MSLFISRLGPEERREPIVIEALERGEYSADSLRSDDEYGTEETVLTGGGIHTLLHEINAASEMNGDVYEGVPSGVAWACHEHPEVVADASASACGAVSGSATMHGGGGEHDVTVAARGAAA